MYLLYQQNIQNQIEGGLMTMDMYKAKVEKELTRDEDMIAKVDLVKSKISEEMMEELKKRINDRIEVLKQELIELSQQAEEEEPVQDETTSNEQNVKEKDDVNKPVEPVEEEKKDEVLNKANEEEKTSNIIKEEVKEEEKKDIIKEENKKESIKVKPKPKEVEPVNRIVDSSKNWKKSSQRSSYDISSPKQKSQPCFQKTNPSKENTKPISSKR